MAALWDPRKLMDCDEETWNTSGLENLTLVTEEHRSTPLADRDLASIVQTVFSKAQQSGTIKKIASFSGPGPLTAMRTSMALLDGLDIGTKNVTIHRADFFQVLLSRYMPIQHRTWAIDNGRQAWWTGHMAFRQLTGDYSLCVEEGVTHAHLEKLGAQKDVKMVWLHTHVEDILFILRRLAFFVLQEEAFLKRKESASFLRSSCVA